MLKNNAPKRLQVECGECGSLSPACFPGAAAQAGADAQNLCTQMIGPLHKGAHLFRAGAVSDDIYIVQSGCFKIYAIDPAGRESINGFRFPGAILGLHGLARGTHRFNAIALMTSSVCKINIHRFTASVTQMPELYTELLRIIGQELISNLYLSGNLTAEERVACFLLTHADKLQITDDRAELNLPMSRSDIATYLRLTLPTVSRVVSRFKAKGLLEADYHHIHILDYDSLKQLCKDVVFD